MKISQTIQAQKLAKELKNIGPKTALKLIKAGITSPEQLRQLGAEKAFQRLQSQLCGRPHAAYLYALEGAIQGCHWLNIPEHIKARYKQLAQSMRQSAKSSSKTAFSAPGTSDCR